jgi:hypothetical protein
MKQLPRHSRTASKLSQPLDHRLNLYSLAASAAGLSALALAPSAEARIVYTPVHVKIISGHVALIDLNSDGIVDFNLSNVYSGIVHDSLVAFFPYSHKGNAMVKGPTGCNKYGAGPAALKAGARIGKGQKFANSANCMAFVPGHSTTGAPVGSYGSWKGVANRYVGVQFQISGQTHYGWVRLSVSRQPFVVLLTGYAYETIANKSIIAGKTKGPEEASAVPVASARQHATLGALALGSSGIPIWRRGEDAAE